MDSQERAEHLILDWTDRFRLILSYIIYMCMRISSTAVHQSVFNCSINFAIRFLLYSFYISCAPHMRCSSSPPHLYFCSSSDNRNKQHGTRCVEIENCKKKRTNVWYEEGRRATENLSTRGPGDFKTFRDLDSHSSNRVEMSECHR